MIIYRYDKSNKRRKEGEMKMNLQQIHEKILKKQIELANSNEKTKKEKVRHEITKLLEAQKHLLKQYHHDAR
jgi:hypothetical protein